MKKITQEELNKIVAFHQVWLMGRIGGIRADLSGTDLRGLNMQGLNLKLALMRESNLVGVNCKGSDFTGANLELADLTDACFQGAHLREANLEMVWGFDPRGSIAEGARLKDARFDWNKIK